MFEILGIIIVLVILAWAFRAYTPFSPPKTQMPPPGVFKYYEAVPSLYVNGPERTFFQMLKRRLPNTYDLHAKVRLEDIIRVSPRVTTPREKWQLRGRIKSRHVDFLVTNMQGRPIAVIELDGASHDGNESLAADTLKNGVFKASPITFYRIKTGEDFSIWIDTIIANLK